MKSYKERLQTAKNFTNNNRLFSVIAAILLIGLGANAIRNGIQPKQPETPTEIVNEEMTEEQTEPEETQGWRFYPIDLYILAIGGGFCSLMIIRERKKARDQLQ